MKILVFSTTVILLAAAITSTYFFRPQWFSFSLFSKENSSSFTADVERGVVTQTLGIDNAKLVPREDFELSFPSAGRVEEVTAREGQLVTKETELLRLDVSELEFESQKAQAVVRQKESNVAKLKAGIRKGEITISSDKVSASKAALATSKKKLIAALQAAYDTADDAVRNSADLTLTNPRSSDPDINFTLSDTSLKDDIEDAREDLEGSLSNWSESVKGLDASDNLTKAYNSGIKKLNEVREFIDDLSYAVNGLSAGGSLTQETLDTWKAALAAARLAVGTSLVDTTTIFAAYRDAGQNLSVSESTLSLQESGYVSQDIDIALFEVEEAQSALDVISERIQQTKLSSPENNLIVQKIYPKKGEYIQPSAIAVILSSPELKMQIDVPEEDMAGIAIGSTVSLRLETYPLGAPALGEIESIEPREIIKNESVYYRVFARLKEQLPDWRSGMTGDVQIETSTKATGLKVPRSSVYGKNGARVVQVMERFGNTEEKEVVTGISDETMIEIKEGLEEGEEVVRYPTRLK